MASSDEAPSYWYMDNSGNLQGPFDEVSMVAWYQNGFLQEDLLVRVGLGGDFKTIGDWTKCGQPLTFTLVKEPPPPPPPPADSDDHEKEVKEIATTENKWFYKDKTGVERGPFAVPNMKEWFCAGYFPPNTPMRSEAQTEFVALSELQKSPSFFLQVSIMQWFYTDKKGQEHGPFWNDEMTEWWHDGFFTPDLKVRKVGELESVPIYLRGFCEFTRRAEPAVPMPPLPSPSPSPSVSVPSATEPQLPSDAASEAADDTATATPSASASATTTLTENASAPTANVAAAAPMAPPQGFYPPPPQFAAGWRPPFPHFPFSNGVPGFMPSPMMMAPPPVPVFWFYMDSGEKEQGPYTPDQFQTMLKTQAISLQTKVRKSTESTHVTMGTKLHDLKASLSANVFRPAMPPRVMPMMPRAVPQGPPRTKRESRYKMKSQSAVREFVNSAGAIPKPPPQNAQFVAFDMRTGKMQRNMKPYDPFEKFFDFDQWQDHQQQALAKKKRKTE